MTKKNYVRAAKIVNSYFLARERVRNNKIPLLSFNDTIHIFCEFFEEDNPKFDKEKFAAACCNYTDLER